MNDELEKYFAGTLSATEKTEFLNKLRDNPEAKKEFARMKAVWAVSGLMAQEGDPQKTVRGIAEFDKRLKRRSVHRFRIGFFKYAAMIVLLVYTKRAKKTIYGDQCSQRATSEHDPSGWYFRMVKPTEQNQNPQ